MRKMLFLLLGLLAVSSCTTSKSELLIGTWKVESVNFINWNEFESNMTAIAEQNIDAKIKEEYWGQIDAIAFKDEIAEKKSKYIENFTNSFKTIKDNILASLNQEKVFYKENKTFEYLLNNEVISIGTWDINEAGTQLTETDNNNKTKTTILTTLNKTMMEFETETTLRENMTPKDQKIYDAMKAGDLIDYKLKFFLRLSKI